MVLVKHEEQVQMLNSPRAIPVMLLNTCTPVTFPKWLAYTYIKTNADIPGFQCENSKM